jgi:subtilisin-like proprotein convertase family protein
MRRTVLLLASTALAVLLASGVAFAATDTLSNSTRITIPERGAATPYPSAITVSGLGTVTDVDLKLNGFSHTYPDAAKVELVGPSGTSVTVMSGAGGSYDVSNIDLTLDDEATSALPSWNQLSGGSFRPRSPLSAFDGTNPNGVWELYVDNVSWGAPASFSGGWSLSITSEGAVEPPPPDTTPPDTRLLETLPSALSSDANPRFGFRSSETGSTFECKLDGGAFQSCTTPKRYFVLPEGQHTFQVRAKDASGNTDQTPAQHTWTVDSLDPEVTFTQRPGTATGPDRWDEWVTNDRSPTWAWNVEELNFDSMDCDLYDYDYDDILYNEPCSSPYTFEGELPDGDYTFEVDACDKAYNSGDAYNDFEVDTVAPTVVSATPTGRRVSRSADVKVIFDDNIYDSKQFVNIYRKGSNTPLAVYRYYEYDPNTYEDVGVEIDPKKSLRAGTTYTVKVTTGVNDGANNLEAAKTWSFKTR